MSRESVSAGSAFIPVYFTVNGGSVVSVLMEPAIRSKIIMMEIAVVIGAEGGYFHKHCLLVKVFAYKYLQGSNFDSFYHHDYEHYQRFNTGN